MSNALLARALVFAFPCAAMAQIAILQIRIVEGEGAVHAPGARAGGPLVVEVTEETGRPVAGAAVTFHFPEDGPSGTFANGLRTDMVLTDTAGRAAVRGFQLNRVPGSFEFRIVAVKGEARAGTVSPQYIAAPKGGGKTAGARSGKRWLLVAAIAVAAAGGGLAAARSGGARAPGAPPGSQPPSVTIGSPTIVVGKP